MAGKSSEEAHAATVSSLNSDHSSEHLIASHAPTPTKDSLPKPELAKSVTTSEKQRSRRLLVALGLCQVAAGALLVGGGALAVTQGAALARAGAPLWAGCLALVAGVVGVLAGINDCHGLDGHARG